MTKQYDLIEYLVGVCSQLPMVKALYLKGSIARGHGDEYSDVDFYCLVDEEAMENMLFQRIEILEGYKKILFLEHVNFGSPQIIAIYEDNVHLDFYVTHTTPQEGTDALKALYDPKCVLSQYQVVPQVTEKTDLIERLNSIIYTAQEVYAAYGRKDSLWCHRLLSHMMADLGLVYSVLYQPNKPVVHLKGLWKALPESVRVELDEMIQASNPERYAEAAYLLLVHCLALIQLEFEAFQDKLYIGYLEYMIRVFEQLKDK